MDSFSFRPASTQTAYDIPCKINTLIHTTYKVQVVLLLLDNCAPALILVNIVQIWPLY